MPFKRSAQRYGRSPEAETPYQRAGQMWDERIGSARAQAHNWRLMAFGSLALSASLAAGVLWQSAQSRVTPYVVEVDRLGEARAVSAAERGFRPTDPQIAWHLARFITNIRSISLDPVVMRRDWLSAYDFATRRGAAFLDAYARAANPFARIGDRTTSVQIVSVVRASERSFQVKWSESAFERGAPAGSTHWTAILTIVTKTPSSTDVLRKNPLGIYIDAIDWSREIDAAGEARAPTTITGPKNAGSAAAPAVLPPSDAPEVQP